MTQGFKILCIWMVLASPGGAQLAFGTLAIQTSVSGGQVCGLAGQLLQLPDELKNAPRAWVTIIESNTGGPARDLIRWRNRTWVSRQLMSSSQASRSKAELDARFRHCRDIQPRYFEAVLVQHGTADGAVTECSWLVDWDLDQDFSDEVPEELMLNLVKPEASKAVFDTSVVEISRSAEHHPVHADVYQPFAVAEPEADPAAAASEMESRRNSDLPKSVMSARSALLKLDDISVRKQHLLQVVDAADDLLNAVQEWPVSGSESGQSVQRELVADTLYRRGRALGYMELPDVVAIHPIKDQQWLDSEFEATFQRLQDLVDVTKPKYILLAIRRERRRGNRGLALNLVDQYRKTHPDPVWHFKKKLDLMTELGATLHAYQAACEMWLKAEKPDRPTCCVIRIDSDRPPVFASDWGTWQAEVPRRPQPPEFHEVSSGLWEAIVWLKSPANELSERVLSAELKQADYDLPIGSVRCFHLQMP